MNLSTNGFRINGRLIGPGHRTYIVAEMSANHNQNIGEAIRIIEAAKQAGADAIKLQTYTAGTLTIDSDREYFRVGSGTIWSGRTLYDLYREAHTPWEWQPKLAEVATGLGLDLFSTPFDDTAVAFLEAMNVPAYKVASFEIVDLPLIRTIAETGKPLIMSTGMASLREIEEAVETAHSAGNQQIILLKCTSAYPAPAADMNLRTMQHMQEHFGVPVGLSDHTLGPAVPVAAVALGASLIEKHFSLSRSIPGPDSQFSLEPEEFRTMVDLVRTAEEALGEVSYEVSAREAASLSFRRSLFVVKDVRQGEILTSDNVRSIRPSNGLPPKHMPDVLRKKAARDIERGTPLSWEHISQS